MQIKGRLTRQERQLMTRALLIEAAERVFLREGFEHASVEHITEEAGFSRGAFYSNFANKDDLALAVVDKRRRHAAGAVKTFQRIADPSERHAAIRDWLLQQRRQKAWIALRIELSRRAAADPALAGRLAELCRQEIQTCAQPAAEGISSKGGSPVVAAIALLAVSHGLGGMGFDAAPELDQLCEAAANLVFDRVTGG